MTLDQQIKKLNDHGFYVGPRNSERNTDFEGAFMVCDLETLDEPETRDASNGGYCIVGDDLLALVKDAYDFWEDNFEESYDPSE